MNSNAAVLDADDALCVVFHAGGTADVDAVVVSPRGGACVSALTLGAPSSATAGKGTLVLVDPDAAVATLLDVVVVTT